MALPTPTRALRALPSSSSARASRTFTTSAVAFIGKSRSDAGAGGSDTRARPWSVMHTPKFGFDDATSLGWMRMFRIQEGEGLVRKIEEDRAALRAANKTQFKPPTSSIRLTSTIDLSSPSSKFHTKSVLLVPVSSLPLSNEQAVHRFKLIAGPRWSPGRPGREEFLPTEEKDGEGKEGWVKISEERFSNGAQNRRSVSDILDRLVEAANDPNSPLPADTPLDTRHLLARHRKKRSRQNPFAWSAQQTLLPRHQVVGGVRGFPAEWLAEEVRGKAVAAGGSKEVKKEIA
ncbi:hypothetical protein CI109_105263 [Kwoniella shandongensis]|uniref:Uncharacterized protein n=1 Tax=Kwoniella shandongensis TaxID=1734106 RepID=A0A5M6C4K1_9TREE|nr:uncharacterized protein CI109_002106 [Kwoniella shandongensis]KAA5529680.1 hypothetical protein CI109_002106 [Kwoniella shandongensis]